MAKRTYVYLLKTSFGIFQMLNFDWYMSSNTIVTNMLPILRHFFGGLGVLNKTIIILVLVGYEIVIAK